MSGDPTNALSFGVGLSPYSRFESIEDIAETVVAAEELGFGTIGFPEHLLPPSSMTTNIWYDQAVLASFLAARTQKILLMPAVHVAPYHPPVQAAKALATVDFVSGGRLRLGVGVGWMSEEFDRLNLPYQRRGEMTDEYLRAMRELWSSERPSFSGKWVSFDDVSFLPHPTSIAVYIGGTGERSFRRVVELGDGWYPMTNSPTELSSGIARIRELLAEQGRGDEAVYAVCSLKVQSDPELDKLRRHVGEESDNEDIQQASAQSAASAERMSPAVCVERLEELAAAGARLVMIQYAWRDPADLRDQLRWFSSEVMPAFR